MKLWNSKWKRAKSTALIIDPNQTDQVFTKILYTKPRKKISSKTGARNTTKKVAPTKPTTSVPKSGKCDS